MEAQFISEFIKFKILILSFQVNFHKIYWSIIFFFWEVSDFDLE